jgi:transaldolase
MKRTHQLQDLGQSLWLDNMTRGLLQSGTLRRYIREFWLSGLTSNPTIFDHAINNSGFYDDAIRRKTAAGKSSEALFLELALEDLTQAADLLLRRRWGCGGPDNSKKGGTRINAVSPNDSRTKPLRCLGS